MKSLELVVEFDHSICCFAQTLPQRTSNQSINQSINHNFDDARSVSNPHPMIVAYNCQLIDQYGALLFE
jgi:hypothetical protein